MDSVGGVDHGKEGYGDAPMVLRRWAMQRRVEDENSVWIVRWTLASVSTSTLLVASSCAGTRTCHVRRLRGERATRDLRER